MDKQRQVSTKGPVLSDERVLSSPGTLNEIKKRVIKDLGPIDKS